MNLSSLCDVYRRLRELVAQEVGGKVRMILTYSTSAYTLSTPVGMPVSPIEPKGLHLLCPTSSTKFNRVDIPSLLTGGKTSVAELVSFANYVAATISVECFSDQPSTPQPPSGCPPRPPSAQPHQRLRTQPSQPQRGVPARRAPAHHALPPFQPRAAPVRRAPRRDGTHSGGSSRWHGKRCR